MNLPRPRDRKDVNHDPQYRQLRATITQYLLDVEAEKPVPAEGALKLPGRGAHHRRRISCRRRCARPTSRGRCRIPTSTSSSTTCTRCIRRREGPLTVVEGFQLDIKRGECVSLIGHSGCGKSTALSMCAGLTDVSDGGITLDGREVDERRSGSRRRVPGAEPAALAHRAAERGARRRSRLSARQQRANAATSSTTTSRASASPIRSTSARATCRTACASASGLARAFALSPKLLLLDEPFGMLDALTRWDLQEVLMDILKRTKITAICVTHDVDEAILVADRVIMMTNGPRARIGKVMQVDLPRPRTRKMLLEHPRYYAYREELLSFLEEYEHGGGTRAA